MAAAGPVTPGPCPGTLPGTAAALSGPEASVPSMTTAVHALRYLRPSALSPSRLDLATGGGATPHGAADHPRFFTGALRHPDAAAAALLAVADVAAARYHRPTGAASLDP